MSSTERDGGARTLTAVRGIAVGHVQDEAARTGCTAILGPFRAAAEVRGRAAGTRGFAALSPLHVVPWCDALLLTGGSAFGLAAADGVVGWLEARGRGFPTSAGPVPIVPAAVLYDLSVGDPSIRPGPEMGRAAADAASREPVREGRVGAGCGASVGKFSGGGAGEPSGVGSWAETDGRGTVGALAVVNAFGDVVDENGEIVAGARGPDGAYLDTARALAAGERPAGFGEEGEGGRAGGAVQNTTLGVVATDRPLDATALQVVARQAMHAIVRRVSPAATSFDGDLVVALSTGEPSDGRASSPTELASVSARAQGALERAILRAVRSAADGDVGPGGSVDRAAPAPNGARQGEGGASAGREDGP